MRRSSTAEISVSISDGRLQGRPSSCYTLPVRKLDKEKIAALGYRELRDGYREYLELESDLCPSTVQASSYGALFLFRYDHALFWDVVFSSDDSFRMRAKDAIREAVRAKGLGWQDEHSVISRVYHLSSFRRYVMERLWDKEGMP